MSRGGSGGGLSPFLIPIVIFIFVLGIIVDLLTKRIFKPKLFTKDEILDAIKCRHSNDHKNYLKEYIERFYDEPELYKGDPENLKYKEWFEIWKRGEVLDSELKYAPPSYDNFEYPYFTDFINRKFRENFIAYMKIQYNLHLKANIWQRRTFLETIRDFYPEFTPDMKALAYELNMYEELLNKRKQKDKVYKILEEYELSSEYIINYLEDITSKKKYEKALSKLIEYKSKGYPAFTCLFAVENNIKDEEFIKLHADWTEKATPLGIPYEIINWILFNQASIKETCAMVRSILEEDTLTDRFFKASLWVNRASQDYNKVKKVPTKITFEEFLEKLYELEGVKV